MEEAEPEVQNLNIMKGFARGTSSQNTRMDVDPGNPPETVTGSPPRKNTTGSNIFRQSASMSVQDSL